jgi:hypothetical protein
MKIENPYINYGSNLGFFGDSQSDMLAAQDAAFGTSPDYSTYTPDSGVVDTTSPPQADVTPWVTPGSVSTPSSPVQNSSSGNSALLDTFMKTVGTVAGTYLTTQAAVNVAKTRAQPVVTPYGVSAPYGYTTTINPLTGMPVYNVASSPQVPGITGSLTGSSNALLLIGLALAAVVLMR